MERGSWSEAELHRWLARRGVPRGVVGSAMHDAAVLAPRRGRGVLCVDQVILGVHAEADVSPAKFGRKGVDRVFSDLAATAAAPVAVLLALRLPPKTRAAWARAVLAGAIARARAFGADVVGGDLSGGAGPAGLAVSALGELPGKRRAPGRDRAQPGDWVLLTGPVGGSGLGRHLRIEPRLAAGRALWEGGAKALMDVSDGLGIDLARLADASGVRIDLEAVPIHADAKRAAGKSGRSAWQHALGDGEDHELIAVLPPRAAERLLAKGLPGAPAARRVGRVRSGRGLFVAAPGGGFERYAGGGFLHGAGGGPGSARRS